MESLPDDVLSRIFNQIPHATALALASACTLLRKRIFLLFSKQTMTVKLDACEDEFLLQRRLSLFPGLTKLVVASGSPVPQKWSPENVPSGWKSSLTSISIKGLLDPSFLNCFPLCPHLEELNLFEAFFPAQYMDIVAKRAVSQSDQQSPVFWSESLSLLALPKKQPLTQSTTIAAIFNHSKLHTLMFCYYPSEKFWESFEAKVDSEKVKLLRNLDLFAEGDGSKTDADLNMVMRIFPNLYHIDVTGTMFKFSCLQEEFFNKNVKSVNLPWPQANDYSEIMGSFLKRTPGLEKLTIMARDDNMIKVLCDSQGNSLTWLAVLLAEGVSSASFVNLLQSCSNVRTLYIRVDDDTIITEQVLTALGNMPNLEFVQLANRKILFGKTRIFHPSVKRVELAELRVDSVEIECPKAQVVVPPTSIRDATCAKQLYRNLFPGKLVVRVAFGSDTEMFELADADTVQQLLTKVQLKFKRASFLTFDFKKLPLEKNCKDFLETGALVTAL